MRVSLIIFFILAVAGASNITYAQILDETANSPISEISLYIPEDMMVGEQYYGMITYSGDHKGTLGIIKTNPDAMNIDSSVMIQSGYNHGIFAITPKHAGEFAVSVKVGDIIIEKYTRITDGTAKENSLVLTVPEKTRTGNIVGAVHLMDSAGNPTLSKKDIPVHLDGTAGISLPEKITIFEGTTGATFQMHVLSSGSIIASSGILSDTADITLEQPKPRLVLDVYPKIMKQNSFGYYFLWFENDNGTPHIPRDVVIGTIHSAEKEIARMSLKVTADQTSSDKVVFSDGVYYGRIFTGNAGVTSITASVPGFGSDTAEFAVGPASFGSVTVTNQTGVVNSESIAIDSISTEKQERTADTLLYNVIPPVTISEGYIVAALYQSEYDETVHITNHNITSTQKITKLYPVLSDYREIFIASNGAAHKSSDILDTAEIATHANIYEIGGRPGLYDVTVSTPQVKPGESRSFEVYAGNSEKYHINMIMLPVIPGYIQDVAIIHVSDSAGYVVNPKEIQGSISVHLQSDSVTFSENPIPLNSPNSIVRGSISDGVAGTIITHAHAMQKTTHSVGSGGMLSDGIISIDAPEMIHSHEPFVATAHLTEDDTITANLTPLIEGTGNCTKENNTFLCTGPGSLSVFSEYGTSQISIQPYMTPLDVIIEFPKNPLSSGRNYTIPIYTDSNNYSIFWDGAIAHDIVYNNLVLFPEETGTFEGIITVSSPGSTHHTESFEMMVNDLAEITVLASDLQGNKIGVDSKIIGTGIDHLEMTDYTIDIPRGSLTISYPDVTRHGNSGYEFDHIMYNDTGNSVMYHSSTITIQADHNHSISAVYQKVILVDVIDGNGGGVYKQGDIVTVSAPDKYIMAFLVRDVLDSWEGLDSKVSTVKFAATKDTTITATYRTDYTGAVVIFVIVGVLVTVLSFRENNSYYLKVSQLLDFLRNGIIHMKKLYSKKQKP